MGDRMENSTGICIAQNQSVSKQYNLQPSLVLYSYVISHVISQTYSS